MSRYRPLLVRYGAARRVSLISEVRWPRSTNVAKHCATSRPASPLTRRRLRNGTITDLADGDDPGAQIRLVVGSDDLLSLVAGKLNFASAWASGRVSVKASFTDLLKLRKLL
jgi:hypothetical protein